VVYGNLAVVGMRFHGVVNFSPSAHTVFCTCSEQNTVWSCESVTAAQTIFSSSWNQCGPGPIITT